MINYTNRLGIVKFYKSLKAYLKGESGSFAMCE